MSNNNGKAHEALPILTHEFRRLSGELRTAYTSARSVLVASALGGEGVTTIAVNLARALAEDREQRILLVDANCRAPAVHLFFGLELAGGLRDWSGHGDVPYKPTSGTPNLLVLTAGMGPTSAFDEINPATLRQLARTVRETFDFVLWDMPPLLRYADGLALASVVDGVLLVVEADHTKVETLELMREQLVRVGAKLLGAILNRSERFLPRVLRSRYDN